MKKLTVMVVDDEPLVADTILEILKEDGIDGFAFSSGQDALTWFHRIKPDAVIMDVIMPGISGIAAAIEIRKMSSDCRVILFSGQSSTADLLNEARLQGHRLEVLEKPIKPEVLLAKLLSHNGSNTAKSLSDDE
jgi:CheY-like chemotaxis protein